LLIKSIKRLFIARYVSRERDYLLTLGKHIPQTVIKIQVLLGIMCGENYRMPGKSLYYLMTLCLIGLISVSHACVLRVLGGSPVRITSGLRKAVTRMLNRHL